MNECRNTEHTHLGEHTRMRFCTPEMPPNQHLVGKRVQLPAWDGSWMRGDRYGVITSVSRDGERFYVKTDKANATRRYSVAELGTDNAASLV